MKQINFSIQELLGVGFTMVVLGIGLAYGVDVLVGVRDDFDGASTEALSINNTIESVTTITDKLPTIATIVVASVIIGVLVTYLWARFANM